MVSVRLRRGSCVAFGMLLCIAAYARPAREHDSLFLCVYFVPFWHVSCFVRVIMCAADMRAREVRGWGGVRRVRRVMRDRSVESGESTAWRRDCEGVRHEVCLSVRCCVYVFVSCRLCVDAQSCVVTGSKAPCRVAFLADSRAFACVSARVCVETIADCGASDFARVFVFCRVACSCVAVRLES